MRTEPARLLLPLLAAALFVGAACSGGSDGSAGDGTPHGPSATVASSASAPPTPVRTPTAGEAEYFSNLEAAMAGIHEQAAALAAFRREAFDPSLAEQTRLGNSVEFARRYQAYAASALAALDAIAPPPGLEAAHAAIGFAFRAVASAAADLIAQLEQSPVSTEQALADLYSRAGAITMDLRTRDSCYDLQALAASLGTGVDLQCDR